MIAIKDMEMPKSCEECPLCQHYPLCGQTWCRASNAMMADFYEEIPYKANRPSWCPLIDLTQYEDDLK